MLICVLQISCVHWYEFNSYNSCLAFGWCKGFIVTDIPSNWQERDEILKFYDSVEITNKMQPFSRIYYSTVHWQLNMFRAAYHSSSGALTAFPASGLHKRVVTGRGQVWVGTQAKIPNGNSNIFFYQQCNICRLSSVLQVFSLEMTRVGRNMLL